MENSPSDKTCLPLNFYFVFCPVRGRSHSSAVASGTIGRVVFSTLFGMSFHLWAIWASLLGSHGLRRCVGRTQMGHRDLPLGDFAVSCHYQLLALWLSSPAHILSSQGDWKLPEENKPASAYSGALAHLAPWKSARWPRFYCDTFPTLPPIPTTSFPHHHLHPGMKSWVVSAKNILPDFPGRPFHTVHLAWLKCRQTVVSLQTSSLQRLLTFIGKRGNYRFWRTYYTQEKSHRKQECKLSKKLVPRFPQNTRRVTVCGGWRPWRERAPWAKKRVTQSRRLGSGWSVWLLSPKTDEPTQCCGHSLRMDTFAPWGGLLRSGRKVRRTPIGSFNAFF